MSSSASPNGGNVIPLRPPQDGGGSGGEDRSDVALYISQMTLELERLANTAGLELVSYFLALARIEADASARTPIQPAPPPNPQAPYLTE